MNQGYIVFGFLRDSQLPDMHDIGHQFAVAARKHLTDG